MECNFLLLYLWLLALFYMLPFFWNTHYSYVVFLSVFCVHHIPFVHLSPYSFFPLPTEEVFKTYTWSYFSTVFTIFKFFHLNTLWIWLLRFLFPYTAFSPYFTSSIPISMSQSFLFYLILHYFILFRIFFNFIKDAKQLSKVCYCFSFVLAFSIFSAVLWFCIM